VRIVLLKKDKRIKGLPIYISWHLMIRRGGLFECTYNIYFYSETNRKNKKDKQQKYKLYVKTKKIIHDDTLTTYDM